MTVAVWDRHAVVDPYGAAVGRVGDGSGRWSDRAAFRRTGVLEVDRYLPVGRHFARGLDVGCGPGRHLAALATRADEVVGFDWSAPMRAEATRTTRSIPNVTVVADLGPGVAPFDLVWCRLVVQHQPTVEDCVALLEDLAARVADGGALVVQVLHARTRRGGRLRRVVGGVRWRLTRPGLPRVPMTAIADAEFAQWRARNALVVRDAVDDQGAHGWRSTTYLLERSAGADPGADGVSAVVADTSYR